MKIPKKLKIGGHVYDILIIEGDKSLHGNSSYSDLKIKVSKDFPKSQQEETFFHEMLHMIRIHLAIENPEKAAEEKIVSAMGGTLYQVLNDNNLLK